MKLYDPWKVINGLIGLLIVFTIGCAQLNEMHERKAAEAKNRLKKYFSKKNTSY